MPSINSSIQTVVSKTELRKQLRSQRRALSLDERHMLSRALYQHFQRHRLYRNSRRIALYLANDGELDLWPLILRAQQLRKHLHLPVLHKPGFDRMVFARFDKQTPMRNNRFGIEEPCFPGAKVARVHSLDLILMPLVAFDEKGNRLGMGGGFYDRTLAFLNTRTNWHKPRLIGVAYDFQKVDSLPHEPWDIPLDGVVTPTKFYNFHE